MRKKFLSLFYIFLVLLICPWSSYSGTVGKIVGNVSEAGTKTPLPGCNILVEGTNLGAASDVDGDFYILNIPPGKYNVIARMIGYNTIKKTGVSINSDLSTEVNFALSIEAIEGETVEIKAERPLIEKDVTVKKMVMSAQEIRSAPVQDLTDILTLQSGVVQLENQTYGIPGYAARGIEQIHIRGGRSGEEGYLIDGMYIRNPMYGGIGRGTRLNKFAAQEVITEMGVFNAEYGDALSGIINTVTRTGDFEKYEGMFRYWTSEIGGSLPKRGSFLYPMRLTGFRDFAAAFGGPIPLLKDKVSFFVVGETSRERNRVAEFDSDTWTEGFLKGNNPYNTETNYSYPYNPNDANDHADPLDKIAGWRALGSEKITDLFGKLAIRIKPTMNLFYTNWLVDTDLKAFDNDGEPLSFQFYEQGYNFTLLNSDRQTLVWQHQLSSKTYYTVRLSRFFQRRRYLVKNYDTDKDGYMDWLETRLGTDPYNANPKDSKAVPVDSDGDGYPDDIEDNLTLLRSDLDHTLPENAKNDNTITPNSELYPLDNEWLEPWQYNSWSYYSPYYSYVREGSGRYYHQSFTDTYEARLDFTSQVSKHHQLQGGLNGKYHDLFFYEIQLPFLTHPYKDYYHRYPREGAAYLQDKVEYPYMTINLGLRMDVFNYNTTAWENPNDPSSPLVKTKNQYKWSPRIGISHIITDRATFTFGYGIFHQIPRYRNIYVNTTERDLTTWSPIVGNPLTGAQKLTAYEFGVKNQLSDDWAITLMGWSKEYGGLDATERVPAFPFSYSVQKDIDYATSRGVDVVLEKRALTDNLAVNLTYTYSVAKANRADPWEGYRNTDTPETMPKRELLMGYDRTHDLKLLLSYQTDKNTGPSILSNYPFSNIRLDLTSVATSGAPYTPTIEGVLQETNSARMPWYYQINAGLSKIFDIGAFKYHFGLTVENLFDKKNVIDVWYETGKATDPGRRANNRIASGVNSSTVYDTPFFYGTRRTIKFLTEIEF
jgi:hypothetical protein